MRSLKVILTQHFVVCPDLDRNLSQETRCRIFYLPCQLSETVSDFGVFLTFGVFNLTRTERDPSGCERQSPSCDPCLQDAMPPELLYHLRPPAGSALPTGQTWGLWVETAANNTLDRLVSHCLAETLLSPHLLCLARMCQGSQGTQTREALRTPSLKQGSLWNSHEDQSHWVLPLRSQRSHV